MLTVYGSLFYNVIVFINYVNFKIYIHCILFSQPLLILGDLSKESDTKNVMEKTVKHYGKLDVLVSIRTQCETLLFCCC